MTGSPLSTGSSTDLVAFKDIEYLNSKFGNNILGFRTTTSPSRISVINSEFGGFTYSLAVEMLRAIGCVIRGSRTFTANSPRVGFANICIDDQTYESVWNVGVAH